MEDRVGLLLLDRGGQFGPVADVEHAQPRAAFDCPVEVLPPAGREIVDDRHLIAAGEQPVDEV